MRALGLDVGSRTIGLALSDAEGIVASAAGVLERRGHVIDRAAILERVRANGVACVVMGLPLELDGTEGHRARLVRRLANALAPELGELGVELAWWDERYSSQAAERTLIEAGLSRARRRRTIDALAAQHILQAWLDAQLGREPEEGAAP
jgi:putative Holliday junction resolvase